MAFIGKKPYDIRLAHMISQPYYHSDDICGSSFHGLATTVEQKLKNYDFYGARDQVVRCINARQEEMRKRSNPDPAHNHAIKMMITLLNKIDKLINNITDFSSQLPATLVRYNEGKGYSIIINNRAFGGKSKKNRITRKKNKNKNKTRKLKRTSKK